ncbi:MAG: hypothetical protein ACI8PZ_000412 [Myxococcota bacterium]
MTRIVCSDMRMPSGVGGLTDYLMANALFRAVIRNPQDSLTVPGVGGGTVIDAAPWPDPDRLHEAIPLVGGGWLDVDAMETGPDRVTLTGTIRSLRDRVAARAGDAAVVSWVIAPDDPWLYLEGADGLWIHPTGEFDLLDGQLVHDGIVYGHDGVVEVDLGGAIRVTGTRGLLPAAPADAYSELNPLEVSGTAVGASRVVFLSGDRSLGRVPVVDDRFETRAPAGTDAIVSEGGANARSQRRPPSVNMDLPLGERGWIDLQPSWGDTPPRPLGVAYRTDDGRSGRVLSAPDGGRLVIGAGGVDLEFFGGPDLAPVTARVVVPDGEVTSLGIELHQRFDPGDRVLAALGWPGDGSRTWRGTDVAAINDAWRAGLGFVITAPEDEIGTANGTILGLPTLLQIDGSRSISDAGWSVVSWPWSPNAALAAHGAVDPAGLSAADLLAAARGGPNTNRRTVVDLPWFSEAPPPWDADPHPTYVRLSHPGADDPQSAWASWISWLDAGIAVPPVGDLTWVEVDDASAPADPDVLAGLAAGATVATTGPLLVLRWAGATHGEVVAPGRLSDTDVRLTGVGLGALDELVVFGSDGAVYEGPLSSDHISIRFELGGDPGWLMAAAWDTEGSEWVATSPIWRDAPVGNVSPTAP